MAYRVAYEHLDRIAAIVSLAGATQGGDRPPPTAPVNVLQIHGTDDDVIECGDGEIRERREAGSRSGPSPPGHTPGRSPTALHPS